MAIQAIRETIKNTITTHHPDHPGLTLFRYNNYLDEKGNQHEHRENTLKNITDLPESSTNLYKTAFEEWKLLLEKDEAWTRYRELELQDRMFIGLGMDSPLEFGISLSHTFGMPVIPGSSIKGVCAAYADQVWGKKDPQWKSNGDIYCVLFGSPENDVPKTKEQAGAIDFLDAWWVPEKSPFTQEIINCHHSNYYKNGENSPADWDAPIPLKILAVTGNFLFCVRGPAYWNDLVLKLLIEALCSFGIGAKTRTGYGRFKMDKESQKQSNTLVWENADISFSPNDGLITVKKNKGVASFKDKTLIPENFHKKLFKKPKHIQANAQVIKEGNLYSVVKIFK